MLKNYTALAKWKSADGCSLISRGLSREGFTPVGKAARRDNLRWLSSWAAPHAHSALKFSRRRSQGSMHMWHEAQIGPRE